MTSSELKSVWTLAASVIAETPSLRDFFRRLLASSKIPMNDDSYIAEQARRRMAQSQAVASPAGHATGDAVTSAYIGQVARRRMMHSKETALPFRQRHFDVSSQDSMFQVVRGLLPIVQVFWLTDCVTLTPRL